MRINYQVHGILVGSLKDVPDALDFRVCTGSAEGRVVSRSDVRRLNLITQLQFLRAGNK